MKVIIREEAIEDYDEIEKVILSDKYRDWKNAEYNEWTLIRRLRKSDFYIKKLALVAEVENRIAGHVMLIPASITCENFEVQLLYFAPLSIHKDYQGQGIGKKLVDTVLQRAKEDGYKAVIARGHEEFFPSVGFEYASKYNITSFKGTDEKKIFIYKSNEFLLPEKNYEIKYCDLLFNGKGKAGLIG